MNHAGIHHIGNDSTNARRKATTVVRSTVGFHGVDGEEQGCKRSPKGQASGGSCDTASNAFLKVRFLPKLQVSEPIISGSENEEGFYRSLSLLSSHYGIVPMDSRPYGYPYNVSLALWDVDRQLRGRVGNWEGAVMVEENGTAFIECSERIHTNSTFYYIPVQPLHQMLKDPKRKHTAKLFLSVFTYLFKHANIPYYTHDDTYLYMMYDLIGDMDIDNDEEVDSFTDELMLANSIGEEVEHWLYKACNLVYFEPRINAFRPKDSFDMECLSLAKRFFDLYSQYPNQSIFRNMYYPFQQEDGDYETHDPYMEHEVVGMHQYISFVASVDGWLFDNLFETINSDLQEIEGIEEPTLFHRFNGEAVEHSDLDFDARILALIDELVYLLNQYIIL